MKDRAMLFIVTMGLVLLTATRVWCQSSQVVGKVATPERKAISGATVKLISSSGAGSYCIVRTSKSDGTFRLPFDWNRVDSFQGLWEIHAEKEGYISNSADVVISRGKIQPNHVAIVLIPSRYESHFHAIDRHLTNEEARTINLYLFDLQSSNLRPPKLNIFLNLLAHKLDNGIGEHMKSYGLLGDLALRIKRCPGVPVALPEAAIVFGERIQSPGVMWGYVEEQTSQFRSIITFTELIAEPVTFYSQISYSGDIFNLLEPEKPVNNVYLAFSAFILGKIHLREGRIDLARRCFLHAQKLGSFPKLMRHSMEEILKSLDHISSIRKLKTIDKGQQ